MLHLVDEALAAQRAQHAQHGLGPAASDLDAVGLEDGLAAALHVTAGEGRLPAVDPEQVKRRRMARGLQRPCASALMPGSGQGRGLRRNGWRMKYTAPIIEVPRCPAGAVCRAGPV